MAKVCVHDDYKVASGELQPVDVGCAEAELACAGVELDFLRAVGAD